MTRVIAGAAGGRRLAVPPGTRTRPTADRVREALFSALGSLVDLDGARVLDLYAGSGALGLEALSRGAAAATLVESDPRAATVLRANAAAVGLPGARVLADRVERVVAGPPDGAYDVVLADPPYALAGEAVAAVLVDLVRHGWLAADAVVVVERAVREAGWAWPDGLVPLRDRRYGDTVLRWARRGQQ